MSAKSLLVLVLLQQLANGDVYSMTQTHLPSAYKIPSEEIELKFSNDEWTLKQIKPTNGSLYSPIIDAYGYLYVYRLNIDHFYDWNNVVYNFQLFKLSSLSFDIIWYKTLLAFNQYWDGAYWSSLINPGTLTYYISNSTNNEYLVADSNQGIFIINATSGAIINGNMSSPQYWWIDNDEDSVNYYSQEGPFGSSWPHTYYTYLSSYSFANNQTSKTLLYNSP